MKHIIKETEPQALINWKRKNKKLQYKDLSERNKEEANDAKDSLYVSLLKEQGFICCYCEGELKNYKYHIEHIIPQSKSPKLTLEYNNLLCSCQGQVNNDTNLYCGHKKDKWYDKKQFVSPLDNDCEERFKYYTDGHIEPSNSNDKAAKTTIEKLNLNIDKLIARRKSIIDSLIYLSGKELEDSIKVHLVEKENNNGKYNEFYTTIKYLFSSQQNI